MTGETGHVAAAARTSAADGVFEILHDRILTLDLPPGTKVSEADMAAAMGVSRQPVRDAFYRLAKLGFLTIRPQRATTVSVISTRAVMEAQFVRTAIEAETVRIACAALTTGDLHALQALLDRQGQAVAAGDKPGFHALDDRFHREICERSGHGQVWDIIREQKSQMDRVRFLSLAFASGDAYGDHLAVFAALAARDVVAAVDLMRQHLGRILAQIRRIRAEHGQFFAEEDDG